MIDPVWTKWISRSVIKYFDSVKASYSFFLEGQEKNIQDLSQWVELRLDGPRFTPELKNEYLVDLGINLMCSVKNSVNIYDREIIAGYFGSKMNDIEIKRDDGTLFECLQVVHPINFIRWGRTDPALDAYSIGIEAPYRMHIR